MAFVQAISGSTSWSLGFGSDFKTTYHHVALEFQAGTTGNVAVQKKIGGQPTALTMYYIDNGSGNNSVAAIAAPTAKSLIVESSGGEIILSTTLSGGSGSVFWNVVGL